MKLGNIVSNSELVNHEKVSHINYLNYDDLQNIDKTLPTLFIGWFSVYELFKPKRELIILNKEIKKNRFYWEFSFDEKKSDHIDGIFNFSRNVIKYYCGSYSYEMIDPFFYNIKTEEDLEKVIPKDYSKVYDGEDKLYFLSGNEIIGIDKIVYTKSLNFNDDFINNLYEKENNIIKDRSSIKVKQLEDNFPYYPYIKPHSVILL